MNKKLLTGLVRLLLLCCALLFVSQDASALTYYWGRHPDKERLVIVFPDSIPKYAVSRTGRQTLRVALPEDYWETDARPRAANFASAKLLRRVKVLRDGLEIQIRTPAFGYIQFPLKDRGKLVVDVFDDPIGARWKPAGQVKKTAPPGKKNAEPAQATKKQQVPEAPPAFNPPKPPLPSKFQTAAPVPPAATPPAPAQQPPSASQPTKGGSKPAPARQTQAKPEPKPGLDGALKPAKPASLTRRTEERSEKAAAKTLPTAGKTTPPAESAVPPPPKIELPPVESKPAPQPGRTRQPFYTVPYSYRAPIIKDSPPAPDRPSSKVRPQSMQPRPSERNDPGAKPHSSLFLSFPVGTAVAAEIHPPPQTLLAQRQAPEQQKNTYTLRQRIAPPSGAADEPQTTPSPAGQTQPDQAAGQAPVPPNPVPETNAYMERETPPSASSKTPYALRGKIQRPGEQGGRPMLRESVRANAPEPAAATPATKAQPAVSGGVQQPAANEPQTDAPAKAVSGPAVSPARDAPWSGEKQLAMPLSPEPAPGPAPSASAVDASAGEPQRVRAPVVRTTPPAPSAKSDGAPETTASGAPAAAEQPEPAAEATHKLPTDKEMETLDSPYKLAREQQDPPAGAEKTGSGKPGEEGPDFQQVLLTAKAAMANEEYQNAFDVLDGLKKHPQLPSKLRKEVLYLLADAMYSLSQDKMNENFSKVMNAYTEALNYDPESIKASQALYHMGVANLKVGNAREAEAYFNILKDKYPDDPQIPMIYYQWGQFYFERNEFRKAADEFQYVVQKYPDNKVTLPASVFLARSLNELGLDEAAYKIVDYIQKRWPRYYVQYPPVLKLMGDVFYRMGELERSKSSYWTYYNLDPKGDESDMILARLGDIYLQTDHKDTAVKVYEQAAEEFPNKDGGLIAQMRLAEQGVYDTPTLQQMSGIFNRPYSLKPSQVYTMIVDQYPDSPLAPLAQIKLSMWHLWNKEYRAAINDVNAFAEKFPDSKLLDSAREVGGKAFDKLLALYIPEENYQAAVKLWNESPLLRGNQENLTPKARVALATCFWKENQPDKADELLEPFFLSAAMPEQAQNALLLALNIALQQRDWKRILDLGKKVELWDLPPKTRYELDYNMALAYENEGDAGKSSALWEKLANSGSADPKQEAYILYFMAQNARDKGEYKKSYTLAQQSLDYFLEHRTDEQKIKDLLALLIDVTDTAGRTREALKWAIEYSRYVNRKDPDWPALRYRMAQLYKKLADVRKWRSILEELITNQPGTLYGRMAKSDLNSQSLEQKAQEFVPTENM